jgi:hypothetical protein
MLSFTHTHSDVTRSHPGPALPATTSLFYRMSKGETPPPEALSRVRVFILRLSGVYLGGRLHARRNYPRAQCLVRLRELVATQLAAKRKATKEYPAVVQRTHSEQDSCDRRLALLLRTVITNITKNNDKNNVSFLGRNLGI